MHDNAFKYVAWVAGNMPAIKSVAEFGSYAVNGTVREIFTAAEMYIGIDVRPGPNVDVVCDAAIWRPDRKFDCVVCCEVFEHTHDADLICLNAWRLLVVGGIFICTTASIHRLPHSVDGGLLSTREFYRGVPTESLKLWLSVFKLSFVSLAEEDVYAMAIKI